MKTGNVALILGGCGVYDGSEIHEAVSALLAIVKAGLNCQFYAPDMNQLDVINHLEGAVTDEKRNVLMESARIARGKIQALSEFDASKVDFLIIPGGMGAVKNLCDYAIVSTKCSVQQDVNNAIVSMHQHQKPIGAMCIAPVLLAKVLGNVTITLGNPDEEMLSAIATFGANHVITSQTEVCVDSKNKLVTTPAYMLDTNIANIAIGAEKMVAELLKLI